MKNDYQSLKKAGVYTFLIGTALTISLPFAAYFTSDRSSLDKNISNKTNIEMKVNEKLEDLQVKSLIWAIPGLGIAFLGGYFFDRAHERHYASLNRQK